MARWVPADWVECGKLHDDLGYPFRLSDCIYQVILCSSIDLKTIWQDGQIGSADATVPMRQRRYKPKKELEAGNENKSTEIVEQFELCSLGAVFWWSPVLLICFIGLSRTLTVRDGLRTKAASFKRTALVLTC